MSRAANTSNDPIGLAEIRVYGYEIPDGITFWIDGETCTQITDGDMTVSVNLPNSQENEGENICIISNYASGYSLMDCQLFPYQFATDNPYQIAMYQEVGTVKPGDCVKLFFWNSLTDCVPLRECVQIGSENWLCKVNMKN